MDVAALNTLSKRVLDAAFAVHTELGPGLLESAYEACLASEFTHRGLPFQQQLPMPLVYNGQKLADVGYRLDFLVSGHLILEIKAVEAIAAVHHAQLLSYLRLSDKHLGLLVNFNVASLRDGIHRKVNKL
ncbi:GxxExxY protein [Terriglobus sp. RCC_193]|uniref:GxxExxY protein n=1 Tax=Terriglobus sp. RCC_193 TaxID=3239218 RepID=UPI0035263CCA